MAFRARPFAISFTVVLALLSCDRIEHSTVPEQPSTAHAPTPAITPASPAVDPDDTTLVKRTAPPAHGPGTMQAEEGRPLPDTRFPSADAHATARLTYRIIDAPNGTFGYDILSDGRLFVHQTNLPGRPGIEGCRSRSDAEKLASHVIGKIRNGEMPPSVSSEELKALNIP